MDFEKPFKTIEVLDSRTGQICKVACMSCIRGHRTTSCGIPVCRSKVFWTVKRPGRPSNSCTCRFGASGRCQCNKGKSTCPHKPRKGEKRNPGCRCDEQGRFCCLLEPADWDVLSMLGNPSVDFYPSREALDARHVASVAPVATFSPTPSRSASTPHSIRSMPGTPGGMANGIQFVNTTGEHFTETQSPTPSMVTRFGMMGVGAPMGDTYQGQDVLTWDGQAPPAPQDFKPYVGYQQPQPQTMPVQQLTDQQPIPYPLASPLPPQQPFEHTLDFTSIPPLIDPDPPPISASDLDQLMTDYFLHQFPSAICQHCGMNGCTCRNCPAVMQSPESGSWAQCCSRKHVRFGAAPPPPGQPAAAEPATLQSGMGGGCCSSGMRPEQVQGVVGLQGSGGGDLTFTREAQMEMDLSEFLTEDLGRPDGGGGGGCCCGD